MKWINRKNSYFIKKYKKKMMIDKFNILIILIKLLYYNINLVNQHLI